MQLRDYSIDSTFQPSIWDAFDFIGVVSFTGYAKSRIPLLEQSLRRVGLWDRTYIHFCFPTPYNRFLINHLRVCRAAGREGAFNATMGHYAVLKTAHELGARHALVMEDDVRFVDNLNVISDCLSHLPQDYDLAKLEWYFRREIAPERRKAIPLVADGRWADMHGYSFWGDACNAFSRKGMEWKISAIENGISGEFLVCDYFYHPDFIKDGIKAFVSMPLLAVQGVTESTMHAMHKRYERQFLEGKRFL